MDLVTFLIGNVGITLNKTLDNLTHAFHTVRPHLEQARASRGVTYPIMDHNARIHDFIIVKSLLDSVTNLAQSRIIGIVRNRKAPVCNGLGSRARSEPAIA